MGTWIIGRLHSRGYFVAPFLRWFWLCLLLLGGLVHATVLCSCLLCKLQVPNSAPILATFDCVFKTSSQPSYYLFALYICRQIYYAGVPPTRPSGALQDRHMHAKNLGSQGMARLLEACEEATSGGQVLHLETLPLLMHLIHPPPYTPF